MAGRITPDQDTMRRIVFHLQRPDCHITSPASSDNRDGRWPAADGAADLTARSLDALLDELDWLHGTLRRGRCGRGS